MNYIFNLYIPIQFTISFIEEPRYEFTVIDMLVTKYSKLDIILLIHEVLNSITHVQWLPGYFTGVKRPGVMNIYLHLELRLRMSGALSTLSPTPSWSGQGKLYLFLRKSENCKKQLLASSCLSVCMEQLYFYWTDFYKMLYFRIFLNSVTKIQVSLKFDRIIGYFT